MKTNELENWSDYDQRVTAFYHFEQEDLSPSNVSMDAVKEVATSLGIQTQFQKNFSLSAQVINSKSFREFEYLMIDEEGDTRGTPRSLRHLRNILKGKLAQVVTFGDEVASILVVVLELLLPYHQRRPARFYQTRRMGRLNQTKRLSSGPLFERTFHPRKKASQQPKSLP